MAALIVGQPPSPLVVFGNAEVVKYQRRPTDDFGIVDPPVDAEYCRLEDPS